MSTRRGTPYTRQIDTANEMSSPTDTDNAGGADLDARNPRDVSNALGDLSAGHVDLTRQMTDMQKIIDDLTRQLHANQIAQHQHRGALHRLDVTFSGSPSESPREFIYKLQTHQKAYDIPDGRMLCVLEMALRDRALDWFRNLETRARGNYSAVVTLLGKVFDCSANAKKYESALIDRRQGPEESWEQYAKAVRQLAESAQVVDPTRCGYFVRGVREPLRCHLMGKGLEKMIEAEKEAAMFYSNAASSGQFEPELAHVLRAMAIKQRDHHRLQALTELSPTTDVQGMLESLCAMRSQNPSSNARRTTTEEEADHHPRQSNTTQWTCPLCGKNGHTADYCRTSTYCSKCNEPGHTVLKCTGSGRSRKPKCGHCSRIGHTIEQCRKLKQSQQSQQQHQQSQPQHQLPQQHQQQNHQRQQHPQQQQHPQYQQPYYQIPQYLPPMAPPTGQHYGNSRATFNPAQNQQGNG